MKRDAFTSKQASYLTGCTSHQLRYWDKVKLVSPSIQSSNGKPGVPKLYSFRDIVSLRVVKTLLDNGMSIVIDLINKIPIGVDTEDDLYNVRKELSNKT